MLDKVAPLVGIWIVTNPSIFRGSSLWSPPPQPPSPSGGVSTAASNSGRRLLVLFMLLSLFTQPKV